MRGFVVCLLAACVAVALLGGVLVDDASAQCNVSRSSASVSSNSAQILEQAALTQLLQQRAIAPQPQAVANSSVTRTRSVAAPAPSVASTRAVLAPVAAPVAVASVTRSEVADSGGCSAGGGRSRSIARSGGHGRLRPRASSASVSTVSVTRTRSRSSARG